MAWATVYESWGLHKPHSVSMCGSWLNGKPKDFKSLVLLGTAALCWSVWLCRNAVVFDYKQSFLFRLSFRLHTGSVHGLYILQQPTSHDVLVAASHIRWPRTVLPGHKGSGLVLGLTVISVS